VVGERISRLIEMIRRDSDYNSGDYTAQPHSVKLAHIIAVTARRRTASRCASPKIENKKNWKEIERAAPPRR
jgi:hypothetical protein